MNSERSMAPPAPPRRARPASKRKLDHVLASAATLIAEKGFEATSMRDVSTAVGVSLSGLYHYFVSKEDLLYQLQHRTFASLLSAQEEIASEPGTPEARFRRLLIGHLTFFDQHRNELKTCTYELESLRGESYETIESLRRRYYRLMAGAIGDLTGALPNDGHAPAESRHAALFIFGMLNWIFMWYDPVRHGPVEHLGEEMLDLVLHGIRRDGSSAALMNDGHSGAAPGA